ncbi:MAG TPA: glucosamine-6-phosphate deaminase [Verrucomicrobiales bacterium]|nr:glucosamine-6-phosphate deaminase [Verrucomicrobiales bacterium]
MTKVPAFHIFPSAKAASTALADEISQLIRSREAEERPTVLGLATGNTPIQLYAELVRLHEEGLSFRNVVTFNLDEYIGISRENPESYWQFMHSHLFDRIDIVPENIHIPESTVLSKNLESYCSSYERQITEAGGIDLQVLGIGRNGHIGFNEPGASPEVATHATELNSVTIDDAAQAFGGATHVPRRAITMGVKTILTARRITLLAFGTGKAGIVERALTPGITAKVPATYLQSHHDTTFFLDQEAGAQLA